MGRRKTVQMYANNCSFFRFYFFAVTRLKFLGWTWNVHRILSVFSERGKHSGDLFCITLSRRPAFMIFSGRNLMSIRPCLLVIISSSPSLNYYYFFIFFIVFLLDKSLENHTVFWIERGDIFNSDSPLRYNKKQALRAELIKHDNNNAGRDAYLKEEEKKNNNNIITIAYVNYYYASDVVVGRRRPCHYTKSSPGPIPPVIVLLSLLSSSLLIYGPRRDAEHRLLSRLYCNNNYNIVRI